ncbi:MAG: recombinase family protein [Planctomycetota bacterium]
MKEYRDGGKSYRAIAGELNRHKIRSKLGGRWSAQTIRLY